MDFEQLCTSDIHGRIGYTCIGGVTTYYRSVDGVWFVTTDPEIVAILSGLSGNKLIDDFGFTERRRS